MHARPTAWQSLALVGTVVLSILVGMVVARADGEPPSPRRPAAAVPEPSQARGRASGRAVERATAVDDVKPTRYDGQGRRDSVTVTYTVEQGDGAEVREEHVDSVDEAGVLIDQLNTQPQVAAAEIDTVFAALGDGPERTRQWGLDLLEADTLWSGGHACGQTIAVIDSGVNAEHPDLLGIVQPGRDLIRKGPAVTDRSGHGTEVAGIAAAAHGNARGISGLAPGVRVLPIAIEDAAGQMHASDLARGIKYAIEHSAAVINLSLGGPKRSPNVEYWIGQALAAGIPVVASAGNAYQNDNPTIWPAASPHVIAVGAIAPTNVWAPFSSTGEYVALAAPGVAVLTTAGNGGYVAGNGTSLSAPFVSGTLALLRARNPKLTPAQLRQVLTDTSKDLGPPGWDPQFGHGVVDPVAALTRVGGQRRKCFTDIGALTLADQIERLAFAGITDGCLPERFCPARPVTRGQMATFLSRAINQPPTDADFFDDDEASWHEDGVNRLALANIARGCTADNFCPNDPITRGQMAAFLSRALNLPSVGVDSFADDGGDVHEAAINAMSSAEITTGCDAARPELFCPNDTVTRAQMAAFLMRTLDRR